MKLETAEFLLELPRPYSIYFYSLNYFPHTSLTRKMLADGLLDPNEVEGRNTKAWKQFRVSMDWPRDNEEKFYLAIYCLASKNFVPKAFIRQLLDNREYWKKNVEPVFYLAWAANYVRMFHVALKYFQRGELTMMKIKQYGNLRKMISQ
jgi:hypothetical protein